MESNTTPTVEDLFAEGPKYASVKFPTVGTKFVGIVQDQEVQQQREFNPDGPGAPRFWPDGRPMLQVVLTCIDTETGEPVKLYVKGRMLTTAKQAVRAAGMKSFETGCKITVVHTEVLANRAKEYTVDVEPPAQDAKVEAVLTSPDGLTAEALAALQAAGLAAKK